VAGPRTLPPVGADEFRALYDRVHRDAPGGRSGRGALGLITPDRVVAAAREVLTGRQVSLAGPVETRRGPDSAEPAVHRMTGPVAGSIDSGGEQYTWDDFRMNIHGDVDSHLDALCHVIYGGTLHGGVDADSVTSGGAEELSVDLARDGIVGRGVLLDIPRLRGVPWLEPGDHVTGEELAAAEAAQQVRVGAGDLLFVRVGHRRRRSVLGPWEAGVSRAGLHPAAVEFLAERQVAVLGCDANSDVAPSVTEGADPRPRARGARDGGPPARLPPVRGPGAGVRGTAPLVVPVRGGPLRLPGATGSPVNPVAIL
jgi:kynurenine formamidase